MLHSLLATTGGKVEAAAAIYNSGQESRGGTTPGPGSHVGDYGLDVLERMHYLQAHANGGGGGGGGGGTAGVPAWFTRDLLLEKPQMTGADVKIVQKKTGATVDGFFGPDTQKHVISFQSHHGLQADGAVGSKTAKVLGS
jgi:peptidoglycan hydrolase-like protein with peptidoglycan-binding domain